MREIGRFETDQREVDEVVSSAERYAIYTLYAESLRGYGSGPYTKNLNTALAEASSLDSDYIDANQDYLDSPNSRRQTFGNLAMRSSKSIQAIQIRRRELAGIEGIWTPRNFETVESWQRLIHDIFTNSELRDEFFKYQSQPNAANPIYRTKIYELVLSLLDIDGPVTVLDIASSTNNNLKNAALPLNERAKTPDIEVVKYHKVDEADVERTVNLGRLRKERAAPIAHAVGIDILDWASDHDLRRKTRSDSFYPDELFDTELVEEYDRISASNPNNVEFKVMDAANDNSDFHKGFKVVFASTALYQMRRKDKRTVLANAEKWATDYVVIVDFVKFRPDGSMAFYTQKNWPGHYNVWIKDLKEPKPVYRRYLSFESGRGRRAKLHSSLARLAVAGDYGLW